MSEYFIFTIWSTTSGIVFVEYSYLVRNVLIPHPTTLVLMVLCPNLKPSPFLASASPDLVSRIASEN
jgi:hypothetical protein